MGIIFKDLMLDIETLGNESFSSIISIAAIEFDINTGDMGNIFKVDVDLNSCVDLGLIISPSTILWWLEQSEEARKIVTQAENRKPIINCLDLFSKFCGENDYYIWANSPSFDCGILKDAYKKAKLPIPWDFRKERDIRTLTSLNPKIKNDENNYGIEHNPIDDCKYQINYAYKTWNSLKK